MRARNVWQHLKRFTYMYMLCLLSSRLYIRNTNQLHFIHLRVQLYFFCGIVHEPLWIDVVVVWWRHFFFLLLLRADLWLDEASVEVSVEDVGERNVGWREVVFHGSANCRGCRGGTGVPWKTNCSKYIGVVKLRTRGWICREGHGKKVGTFPFPQLIDDSKHD